MSDPQAAEKISGSMMFYIYSYNVSEKFWKCEYNINSRVE